MGNNNGDKFIESVRRQLFERGARDAVLIGRKADQILQDVIQDFNIPDTGFLQQKTFQKTVINLNSRVLAEFKYTTRGVSYAQYVLLGLGSNRKYGVRNYLEEASNQTLQYIESGSYNRLTIAGSPFKGGRKFDRRKKTIVRKNRK